jgi:4-diphosphocytidyl-2-C-methyl-D-erythritol kinase
MSATPDPWPAPAKLNLFLHVVGQRADGFHLLQTLFQFLDFGDELTFDVTNDGQIQREYELEGVDPGQDLIVRAARVLQARAGSDKGVRIGLTKRLPMGGGIGGGSSDAATTLVALNALWCCGLGEAELAELGLQLGADVPVFVHGRAAWAEGVGERLTPVEVAEPHYVVLIPPVNVSTAAVFSHPELIRHCPPITIRDFLAGRAGNVCEPVVRDQFPQIDRAMKALSEYAPAHLTGTGACVFARFEKAQAAQRCWSRLQKEWQGFMARGLNTSPLRQRLEREQRTQCATV